MLRKMANWLQQFWADVQQGVVKATPQTLTDYARKSVQPRETGDSPSKQRRFDYDSGPMFYLGQQIVRAMQDAGYPARISELYRTPQRQDELQAAGRSKAYAWQSPHQYYEAVDIIHPTLGWDVGPDYWETLASCVRLVAERYDVDLNHGHYWRFKDSAHIELRDWRKVKERLRVQWLANYYEPQWPPTPTDLWERFCEVLPKVAAAYQSQRKTEAPPSARAEYEARRLDR